MSVGSWLAHAFKVLNNAPNDSFMSGASYGSRPDIPRGSAGNERSLVESIYTRIAIDVASVDIRHVRLDKRKRYKEDIESGLNECLSTEANIDQDGRAMIQDAVYTLLSTGSAAVTPMEMDLDPRESGSWDIKVIRVGEVVGWRPRHVRVQIYNEDTGRVEQATLEKKHVAVVNNPFYNVMNKPNTIYNRIVRKLQLLDMIDENTASNKLDVIIQLPYTVRSETLEKRALARRKSLEDQLSGSKYGVAYSDGSEKIIQLNRPVDNNIMPQIEWLVGFFHSQLGITKGVMDGTAEEAEMLNYQNRTVEPILDALRAEMKRKFITKTGRTQGQSVEAFRDPFKLVPMKDLAEMADKFTRNEIVTGNEFRGFIGLGPVDDPAADQLRNKNMPTDDTGAPVVPGAPEGEAPADDGMAEIESVVEGLITKLEGV